MGNAEKGVKQESSYLLLVMKKDQTNKADAEGVYRWRPLAWEPGLDRSGIDLRLFREWVRHSHTSCAHTHWSWSGMEAEWKWTGGVEVDEVGQKRSVEGGFPGGQTKGRQKERGQEGGCTMTAIFKISGLA